MPAVIDASEAVRPHVCERPPVIFEIIDTDQDRDEYAMPEIRMVHAPGTRHICDGCGRVQVVTWVESGYANVSSGYEWVEESRRQRRQRLGLRWWQRG